MGLVSRAAYRARQFLRALHAQVSETDRETVDAVLPPALRPLFFAMPARDQQHSIGVYRMLKDAGCADSELLVAALLHDAGKGQVALWARVAYVLIMAIRPGLAHWLTAQERRGFVWLRALSVQDETAARLIGAAGGSAALTRIVRGSPATISEEFRVALLRAADDRC